MIRIIYLLFPAFLSFFWAITLLGDTKRQTIPRAFLAKFMLLPLVCFTALFFYFAPLPNIYPYFDVLLQITVSLIFPVFYIYIRLLTVDNKFSFKAHGWYLVIPSIVSVVYAFAVLFIPKIEYRAWLYNANAFPDATSIYLLGILRKLINIQFLVVIVASYIASYLLLKKHAAKAELYYSDINDGCYNNAKLLNYTILFSGVSCFVVVAVGRYFIMSQDTIIYALWSIFAILIYFIGYMGLKQKPVNPTFDMVEIPLQIEEAVTAQYDQKRAHEKILELFEDNKVYLNNQLNIMDVANAVGTNRTYISVLINMYYNQNFCTFVNTYRIAELERVIRQNPKFSYVLLMQLCGFGSVNSMKRSVANNTGMPISEWKKQVLASPK